MTALAMKVSPRDTDFRSLALEDEEMNYFCKKIQNLAGIALKSSKRDLIKSRLRSRLVENEIDSYREYRKYLESLPTTHQEWQVFINLLTTNKTDFFREVKHFEFLVQNVLPLWLETSEKVFKVWSAASSTGEEAYTLAMVLERHLPKDRDFKILASDVDTNVLNTARNAVYPVSKKSEIPDEYQSRSIDVGKSEARGWFRIKPKIRGKVFFKQHNLVDQSAPDENLFDLVLCRNVLIYFDKDVIEFISKKTFHSAKPNGHLFIGHSESLQGIDQPWKPIAPSIYGKGI